MKNLKIISDNDLKDWAKEIFKKNSFKMIDVSKKKETDTVVKQTPGGGGGEEFAQ